MINLGGATRLAIVGDWGTGEQVATNLMQQVASLNPDVLIHLGDVYYAGTQSEEQGSHHETSLLLERAFGATLCPSFL